MRLPKEDALVSWTKITWQLFFWLKHSASSWQPRHFRRCFSSKLRFRRPEMQKLWKITIFNSKLLVYQRVGLPQVVSEFFRSFLAGAWTHGILQGLGGDGKHDMIYMHPPAIKHGNMATGNSFQRTGDFLRKSLIHLQIFGRSWDFSGPQFLELSEAKISSKEQMVMLEDQASQGICCIGTCAAPWADGPQLAPLGAGRRNGTTLGRCDTRITGPTCPMVTFWSLMRKNLRRKSML